MKKVVRLTENDLTRIVKKVLREQNDSNNNSEKEINGRLKKMSNTMTSFLQVIGSTLR